MRSTRRRTLPDRTSLTTCATRAAPWVSASLTVAHAWSYHFTADDTFIGLRYIRNLLDGHGLVFNPIAEAAAPIEGYSNLLWLLLVAAFGAPGIDLVTAARVLGAVATALLAATAAKFGGELARGHARPAAEAWGAWSAGLVVAGFAPLMAWGLSGMETPLFALLVLLAARAERPLHSGLYAGLAALTRPEGAGIRVALIARALCASPPTTTSGARRTSVGRARRGPGWTTPRGVCAVATRCAVAPRRAARGTRRGVGAARAWTAADEPRAPAARRATRARGAGVDRGGALVARGRCERRRRRVSADRRGRLLQRPGGDRSRRPDRPSHRARRARR